MPVIRKRQLTKEDFELQEWARQAKTKQCD